MDRLDFLSAAFEHHRVLVLDIDRKLPRRDYFDGKVGCAGEVIAILLFDSKERHVG